MTRSEAFEALHRLQQAAEDAQRAKKELTQTIRRLTDYLKDS